MANKYTFNITDSMLAELAQDIANLYKMKDIVNYVHNGKNIPIKYEKLIERPISGIYSNITGYISLQKLLINTLRYCFTKPTNKNTQETKQLRETIMRIKININQLKQVNPSSPEITLKEKEIELINKKIEDSNNTIENNNNIKNKYVNVAESAYNILLRKDNFPQYFYIEICNKLGVRINYEEHFIRDYNNERISVVDGIIKKEFTNDIDRENAMINKKTNQKARYVPPCFRQQTQEENIKEESIESEEEVEEKEFFPTLNKNTSFNSKPLITSIWSNKPNIKEVIREEVKENINTGNTLLPKVNEGNTLLSEVNEGNTLLSEVNEGNTNDLHESNNDEDNWFI